MKGVKGRGGIGHEVWYSGRGYSRGRILGL